MKKMKIGFIACALSLALTACTQMQRFDTKEMLKDSQSSDVARIKVTTNSSSVYAVPQSNCVDLTKTYRANDTLGKNPNPKKGFFSTMFTGAEMYDDVKKSVGMPKVELSKMISKNMAYSSQEYVVDANKPISFFIKHYNASGLSALLDPANANLFGGTFTPASNKDYQLILTEFVDSFVVNGGQSTTAYYEVDLFDITGGQPANIKHQLSRVYACKDK